MTLSITAPAPTTELVAIFRLMYFFQDAGVPPASGDAHGLALVRFSFMEWVWHFGLELLVVAPTHYFGVDAEDIAVVFSA